MRRIYESDAVRRDDSHFTPGEGGDGDTPQAMRSVPGTTLSRLFLPAWLRHRALSVAIETPQPVSGVGRSVPFQVTLRNALPVPVTIATESPLLWTWSVDGRREASDVPRAMPEERGSYTFGRGERKRFTRTWSGSFRVSEREWAPADPGEYTIAAALAVPDAAAKGLSAETTVRIE